MFRIAPYLAASALAASKGQPQTPPVVKPTPKTA